MIPLTRENVKDFARKLPLFLDFPAGKRFFAPKSFKPRNDAGEANTAALSGALTKSRAKPEESQYTRCIQGVYKRCAAARLRGAARCAVAAQARAACSLSLPLRLRRPRWWVADAPNLNKKEWCEESAEVAQRLEAARRCPRRSLAPPSASPVAQSLGLSLR